MNWLIGRKSVHSGRSFFFIAPKVRGLDIVWVVVSLGSAHSFWAPVVGDDVVIIRELFVADSALSVLLKDLPVEDLAHLGGRPKFPVSPRMMRVLDTLHSQPYDFGLGFLSYRFAATAKQGSVYWAIFIAAKPHDTTPEWKNGFAEMRTFVREIERGGFLEKRSGTIPVRGESMSNLANVVQQLKKKRDQAQMRIEQIDNALNALSGLGSLRGRTAGPQHTNSPGRKRKTMSGEARKRIAAAQRARWAKWKAARRSK